MSDNPENELPTGSTNPAENDTLGENQGVQPYTTNELQPHLIGDPPVTIPGRQPDHNSTWDDEDFITRAMAEDDNAMDVDGESSSFDIAVSLQGVIADETETESALLLEYTKLSSRRKRVIDSTPADDRRRAADSIDRRLAIIEQDRQGATTRKEIAQANLKRVQDEQRRRNAAPAPAMTVHAIPLDLKNPVHSALNLCQLVNTKPGTLPVYPNTNDIHWSKLPLEAMKDFKPMDLKNMLKASTASTFPKDFVTQIRLFLTRFYEAFHPVLTVDLFDLLAWRYILKLVQSDEASTAVRLGKELDALFATRPETERDWEFIQACIRKVYRFESIEHSISTQLYNLSCTDGEDVLLFCERTETLIDALNASDMGQRLTDIIFHALPGDGQEKVLSQFGGSRFNIPSYTDLLDFIKTVPSLCKGDKADGSKWHARHFGPKNLNVESATSASSSSSSSSGGRKQPFQYDKTASGQSKKTGPLHTKRPSSPPQKGANSFVRAVDPAKASQTPDSDCVDAMCISIKNEKGYGHKDNACFRFSSDPNKVRAYNNMKAERIKKTTLSSSSSSFSSSSTSSGIKRSNGAVAFNGIKIPKISDAIETLDSDEKGIKLCYDSSYFDFLNDFTSTDTRKISAFITPGSEENRLVLPILINGHEYTALYDPGCTHSVIDRNVALDLLIPTAKVSDTSLADGKTLVPSEITIDRVTLECNEEKIDWQLYVMTLDNYAIYLGADISRSIGIQITGVKNPLRPLKPKPQGDPDLYIETDGKPPMVQKERPQIETTPAFIEMKNQFLQALEESLAKNAAIDPASHCEDPFMLVELQVKPNTVIFQKGRRNFSQAEEAEIDETINKWKNTGVIVEAPKGTPHLNRITCSSRKDLEGNIMKYRVCLDPRDLNQSLEQCDNFPLPIINDILDRTAGHKYFTTVDLRQAYHRLPLAKQSQPFTAFAHKGKHYMFARAPFGLKPMTSIFQRGMMRILGDLDYVAVYVDDIVIFSMSYEEHIDHVKEVIDRLTESNLIINKEKSHFLCTQVVLLGFVIDEFGKRINPEKIANVKSWAPPTNGKMVQRYLGMFNYFREYIPLYSTIAAPLDALRNKKGNFKLTELEMTCFDQLKTLVASAPVLSFPDFSAPFYVATDASNLGIGAVLYQLPNGPNDESKVNYISFMARALHTHEKHYPAYKKELLGIVYALNKFHYYIWGRRFTLFTDHRPLTYIHQQKELPAIVSNWRETILNYDFVCTYRPGLMNIIPDALSRAFPEELWPPQQELKQTLALSNKVAAVSTRNGLRRPVDTADPSSTIAPAHSSQLADQLGNMSISPTAAYTHVIQSADKERNIVSESERDSLLDETHKFGHLGANAMVKALHLQGLEWPKMKEACLRWVSQCPACQHFNIARKGYHPLKTIHAELPFEHIAVDTAQFKMSESGNMFALVVVDVCTRFVFLEPMKNKEAATVAPILFKLFCSVGFPKIIQSDNGSEFVNEIIHHLVSTMNVDHRLTTPYHPRANGVAERHVRSFKDLLKREIEGESTLWDIHLPMTQLQLNTRVAHLHSSTPFSLFFGRSFAGITDFSSAESHLLTDEQLEERLKYLTVLVFPAVSEKSTQTQKDMIAKFNRTHRLVQFPPGSFVMVTDAPAEGFEPPYEGPFKVIRQTTRGSYVLRDAMNRVLARNYAPEQMKLVTQSIDAESHQDDHHEVEKILSHRDTKGGRLYTVKWKGYDEQHNSEIPFANFDSPATVTAYYNRINDFNPHVIKKKIQKAERLKRVIDRKAIKSKQLPTSNHRDTRTLKGRPRRGVKPSRVL